MRKGTAVLLLLVGRGDSGVTSRFLVGGVDMADAGDFCF